MSIEEIGLHAADDYAGLSRDKFDALVTGELTHRALYYESAITSAITSFFAKPGTGRDFRRLLLDRDGLNFQDKIDILRAMSSLFADQSAASELKPILKEVEDLKSLRNAFAHGVDEAADDDSLTLKVCVVGRSGQEKVVCVTPDSHAAFLNKATKNDIRLQSALHRLKAGEEIRDFARTASSKSQVSSA